MRGSQSEDRLRHLANRVRQRGHRQRARVHGREQNCRVSVVYNDCPGAQGVGINRADGPPALVPVLAALESCPVCSRRRKAQGFGVRQTVKWLLPLPPSLT